MMQSYPVVSSHNSGSGVNVAELCLASHKCIHCGRSNVIESWIHGLGDTKIDVQIRTSFGFDGELMLGGIVSERFVDYLPAGKVAICALCSFDNELLDSFRSIVAENQRYHNVPTGWTPLSI